MNQHLLSVAALIIARKFDGANRTEHTARMTCRPREGSALQRRSGSFLVWAVLLCCACSDSDDEDTDASGSNAAADDHGATTAEDQSSTDDASTGDGATDQGVDDGESTGQDPADHDVDDDATGETGASCTADNQPDTRNGNDMCFSPFVRASARNAQDFLGCDCVECGGEMGFCSEGAHWFCVGAWFALEVDTCESPTACPLVWLKEFESVEQQECQAADGTYECTWFLDFSDHVSERKGFQDRDGRYRCEGMNVIGIFGPSEISAPFNPDTGILTWDGVEYRIR